MTIRRYPPANGREELDLLKEEDFAWVESNRKLLYSWIMRTHVSSITIPVENADGETVEAVSMQERQFTTQRAYVNVMMVTFRRRRRYDDRRQDYVAVPFDAKVEPYHSCALIQKWLNWVIACDEGRQSSDNRELKYSLTYDTLLKITAEQLKEVQDLPAYLEQRAMTFDELSEKICNFAAYACRLTCLSACKQ